MIKTLSDKATAWQVERAQEEKQLIAQLRAVQIAQKIFVTEVADCRCYAIER